MMSTQTQSQFFQQLKKYYTFYTGGFIAFVIILAILEQMGLPPKILVLMIGIGASLAFMMPVATPPNAIVFATGHIRQRDMLRAGFVLNLICSVLLATWGWLFF